MGNKQSENDKSQKKQKSGLVIKTCTWNKDSHSLYDYESDKLIKKDVIPITGTCNVVRMSDEVRVDTQTDQDKKKENLFSIKQKGNGYYFSQDLMYQQNFDGLNKNSAWIAVRSLENLKTNKVSGFQLSVNDYIKLGRVRFRIKEVSFNAQNTSGTNNNSDTADTNEYPGENKESCRICLGDTYTKINKFIQPCNCAGTVAYVHEECLQQWLKSKIHCKETAVHSFYSMKNLECELCKFKYTDSNSFVGKNFESVLIQKPSCPYLMLELLSKEKNVVRAIQLIKYEKINSIIMGRGSDCNIRINDISVSREHATIKLENNKFILEDHKSKFGTLVLIQKPIELSPNFNKIEVQIGRSICYFQVKNKSNFLGCCSGKAPKKNDIMNTNVISKATQAEFMENDARFCNQYADEEQKIQDYQGSPIRIHRLNGRSNNSPSPSRVPQRGGAIGTRQQIFDTMQHIFTTNQLVQQPQTVDDLQKMEELQENLERQLQNNQNNNNNANNNNNNNNENNNNNNVNIQNNNIENPDIDYQESHPQQIPAFTQNNSPQLSFQTIQKNQ